MDVKEPTQIKTPNVLTYRTLLVNRQIPTIRFILPLQLKVYLLVQMQAFFLTSQVLGVCKQFFLSINSVVTHKFLSVFYIGGVF